MTKKKPPPPAPLGNIWVLTEGYNDYDQHGDYFIHAWIGQPTREQLIAVGVEAFRYGIADYPAYVLAGGGRHRDEDQWYNLERV